MKRQVVSLKRQLASNQAGVLDSITNVILLEQMVVALQCPSIDVLKIGLSQVNALSSMIILTCRYTDHADGPPLNDNHDSGGYHRDECSICRRPFTMAGYFTLRCSHIFHISCVVW